MRVRRRIVNLVRKLIFGAIFLGVNLTLVGIGLFLPDLLAFTGIDRFDLRVAGFFVVLITILISIAFFEILDNI